MLSVQDVEAGYGQSRVLCGVSIEVGTGEVVCLLGANGAGKTTLFRVISGLLAPSAGQVQLESVDVTGMPPHRVARLGLGQVPEGRQLFRELSVLDNLQLAEAFGSRRRASDGQLLEQVYALLPVLRERRHQRAGTLSGGQQQMVAIGRALMTRPRLLLLDEPSLGLAPQVVVEMLRTIRRLNAEQGLSVLLIEQNAHAALLISHRAYVMEQGRIALSGTADEVLADERVRALYLGDHAAASAVDG
ncbi:MAG: ABC transporter ATP-binding protein [Chloroflexi bacterium]|nr:ABC transporter ATP-binding protein [Chloroflexota bacterium]